MAVRPELQSDGADVTLTPSRSGFAASGFLTRSCYTRSSRSAAAYARASVLRYAAGSPEAARWWLVAKTLSVLDQLWVHYAPTRDFEDAEKLMLLAFTDSVSPRSAAGSHDRERLMPFANLRGFDDRIKLHGITGATGDLRGGQPGYVADDVAPSRPPQPAVDDPRAVGTGTVHAGRRGADER